MITTVAYLRELWRISRETWFGRILIAVPFMLVFMFFIPFVLGGMDRQEFLGLTLSTFFILNFTPPFVAETGTPKQVGFPFQSGFVRPVSTTWLVAVPLAFATVMGVVVYLLQALIVRVGTGAAVPFFVPSVLIACGTICMLATIWAPTNPRMRVFAVVVFWIAVLGYGIPSQFTLQVMFFGSLSWQFAAVLLVATITAIVATLIGVERQRHSDPWSLRPPRPSCPDANASQTKPITSRRINTELRPAWPRSKHQRLLAQVWFDWQRCRTITMAISLIGPVALILAQITGALKVDGWHGMSDYLSIGALAVWPFVCQTMAILSVGLQPEPFTTELNQFDATRPLTEGQMIAVKMLVVFVSMAISWCFTAITIGLLSLTGQTHVLASASELVTTLAGNVPAFWWFAAAIALLLMYISSISIMMYLWWLPERHPTWFSTLFFGGICVTFVVLSVAAEAPYVEVWPFQSRAFWPVCCSVGAAAIVVWCVQVLRGSIESNVMRSTSVLITACLWIVFVICVVFVFACTTPPTPIPLPAIVFGAACLLIPLGTTVANPCVFASVRHA